MPATRSIRSDKSLEPLVTRGPRCLVGRMPWGDEGGEVVVVADQTLLVNASLGKLDDCVLAVRVLLARGADPKINTVLNVSPLHVAAGIGWVEGITYEWSPKATLDAVKMLVDLGLDVNLQADTGRTALHGDVRSQERPP